MIDGIDFGVVVSELLMIPLSDYPFFVHNDGSHHGVRTHPCFAFFRKLEGTPHDEFVHSETISNR
jgi:hypothetical protein